MMMTRRSSVGAKEVYSNSGVAVLEREESKAYNEYVEYKEETVAEEVNQRAIMAKNLDKLLNYEKYLGRQEEVVEEVAVREPVVEEVAVQAPKASVNEDIMPSSTTMQFGDGDPSVLFNEMKKERQIESKKASKMHLSSSGKVLIAVYALVISTIMALIVVNTSLIASLKTTTAQRVTQLNALAMQHEQLVEELNSISSNEYVIDIATNEYNMVK